jgi:WD40 repeat protein
MRSHAMVAAALLLAAGAAGTRMAAADDLAEVGRLAPPPGVQLRFLMVAPDGAQLTAACGDRKLRSWALPLAAGAAPQRAIDMDGEPITGIVYSRDGQWLAASTVKGTVVVARAATGEVRARLQTAAPGRSTQVAGLAIAPDGSRVAIAPLNAPPEMWDVASASRRAVLVTRFGGTNALDFSPDGSRLATADEDTAIRLYDAEGRLRATADDLALESFALAFTPDGGRVAVAGADKTLTLLDAVSGAVVRKLPRQGHPILWLAALRRDAAIVSGSFDAKSQDIPGPTLSWPLDGSPPRVLATDRRFLGGGALRDGRLLLATRAEDGIVLWALP